MKVSFYAQSKSLDLNLIPNIDYNNLNLYTEKLITSRTIRNLNYKPVNENYEGTSNIKLNPITEYWTDYTYDNIKYTLNYNIEEFVDNINNQTNIFDKILNLNLKQVGIVNPIIPKVFCEGNEIHYTILNNGVVPFINGTRTEKNKNSDPEYGRNIKVIDGIGGWGEIKINNTLYASLIDSFYVDNMTFTNAYDSPFGYTLRQRMTEAEAKELIYLNFKTNNLGDFGPFYIYGTGSKVGSAFSFIDDIVYTDYSIRLDKNINFSSEGILKGIVNKSTGLNRTEEQLKKMYFWKSSIITTISDEKRINYYIVVGVKPYRYMLTKQVDRIFFIDLGNTFENPKFDKTDIILYHSDIKTFLKKTNANVVYFTNFGIHPLGNICPNGLVLGTDTPLIRNIVNSINSGSGDYTRVEYEINNIYNIFTNLEG